MSDGPSHAWFPGTRLWPLFSQREPSLDHDEWIDSCPDRPAAEAKRDHYARILRGHGLAGGYGVFARELPNRVGWSIFVGPHEDAA